MTGDHTPYVLWEETLPEGHAVKLIICPGDRATGVILQRNNQLRHVETLEGQALAEQKGWELRRQVLDTI